MNFKIKDEVQRLMDWREINAGQLIKNWEDRQMAEMAEFSKLFDLGPAVYCIQFPDVNEAVFHWKVVHNCSLNESVKQINAGLDQLAMDGEEM